MALLTGGTNANSSLNALKILGGSASGPNSAAFRALVKDDLNNIHPIWPDAYRDGQLFVPNRGILKVLPGDYIMVDTTTGWPILVSARAIAAGPWTHS